jgi:hypothetical protein
MEGPLSRLLISSRSVNKHGRHRQFLFLIGLFKKNFSSETVVSSNPGRGEEYLIQHYVITFVTDLRQGCCVLRFHQTNQTDRHDIVDIV